MVGAPQEIKAANQTGGLYQCDYSTGKCEPIQLQGESLLLLGIHVQTPCFGDLQGAQKTHFPALALSETRNLRQAS